jgi:hypothetical protein
LSIGIGIIVQGYCPMGCGATLRLSGGGEVICFGQDCPRPRAVTELLANNETEHIVWMDAEHWTVQHPLWERIAGRLQSCTLSTDLNTYPPPEQTGRWRARKVAEGRWELKPVGSLV